MSEQDAGRQSGRAVDSDGDGRPDGVFVADEGTGATALFMDTTGDGRLDTQVLDADGDGRFDTVLTDVDGDGVPDVVQRDTTGDGVIDQVTDGDGNPIGA